MRIKKEEDNVSTNIVHISHSKSGSTRAECRTTINTKKGSQAGILLGILDSINETTLETSLRRGLSEKDGPPMCQMLVHTDKWGKQMEIN